MRPEFVVEGSENTFSCERIDARTGIVLKQEGSKEPTLFVYCNLNEDGEINSVKLHPDYTDIGIPLENDGELFEITKDLTVDFKGVVNFFNNNPVMFCGLAYDE